MNEKDRLNYLEERLEHLESEKMNSMKALESVLELDDLQISLNKLDSFDVIVENSYSRICSILKLESAGFFLVEESSGLFSPSKFFPESSKDILIRETDHLIIDNTFSLAIKANRTITVRSKETGGSLIVHALSTVSRTRGVFIGHLGMNKEDIPDAVFPMITLVMNATAHMIESFELYSRNRTSNKLLSQSVKRLELSEKKLKNFNEQLEIEVENRTKELKATNELLENEITERKKIEKLLTQQKTALQELNETLENRVRVETENRRKSEHVLHEQSKLAAMGQMMRAISHQWRQPLNALGMIIQDILDEYDEKGNIGRDYLEESTNKAVKLVMHMSGTIDDFSDIVKNDNDKSEFNVYGSVKDVVGLIEHHYNSFGIFFDIKPDSDSELTSINSYGDSGMFKQVLFNMFANSRDAITERLDSGKCDKGEITVSFRPEGENLVVLIEDNGGGISEDIIDRVFEPYFTTKEESKGTGVGLYLAKLVMEEQMDGTLSVSNRGEGALLSITIPVVDN